MEYINQSSCLLVMWETDPKKRNTNNVISFYVDSDNKIQGGDKIRATPANGFSAVSTYDIVEVKEQRAGSIEGKDYVIAVTQWGMLS